MDLLDRLRAQLEELDQAGLRRRTRIAETPCAPLVRIEGQPLLAFCSNDYLGLASHPRVCQALAEGALRHGAGSGASHLVSGHAAAHVALEQRLASWMAPHIPHVRTLLFSTGYMANMGLLQALGGAHVELFSEELNHASLIDGARLSRAKVQVFPHGDVDALEPMLANSRAEVKLVVTDSVFSMDGDLAPLPALLRLCERHEAWLVLDDAHGFGILGEKGHGALAHFGLQSPRLVYVGTLGKAAGVSGAFVAAHEVLIDWLVQRARHYIYTTASPPALAHALMTSLDLIEGEEGEQRRAHLHSLIARFRAHMAQTLLELPASDTAIQPVIVGSNQRALKLAAGLKEAGLWVPAIRPPTVPPGRARLRVTLSAAHTEQQVDRLCQRLAELAGEHVGEPA